MEVKAEADLREIKDYLTFNLYNPDAAEQLIEQLLEKALSLNEFPERGIRISTRKPSVFNYRKLIHKNYCIVYSINDPVISIHRIVLQSRLLDNLIREDQAIYFTTRYARTHITSIANSISS